MSTQDNKALVRRYVEEIWNKGNLNAVEDLLATDFVGHEPMPGLSPDRKGFKQFVTLYRTAYPDAHMIIEDQVVEGDKVVTRWKSEGTHKGELLGIAPTHKKVLLEGVSINRVVGDKIQEDWTNFDQLGMLQQLGVITPSGQIKG